jgi:alanine racemase
VRPNVFEVDLDAIAHNVRSLRQHIGGDVQLFAALKANAYGFGIERVADTVVEAGADGLAVVEVDHAVALRQRGIDVPILLYGGTPASADLVAAAEEHDLTPTLLDVQDAQTYERHAMRRLKAFLKFDVGLERLGATPEDTPTLGIALRSLRHIELRGVYTHLHVRLTRQPRRPDRISAGSSTASRMHWTRCAKQASSRRSAWLPRAES